MNYFSLIAALVLLPACAEPEPDSPTFGEDVVLEDFAFDDPPPTREVITSESQLMGTYNCQQGPGFVEFTSRGDQRVIIARTGDQDPMEGTWSVDADGRILVRLGGEQQVFSEGEIEGEILTLSGEVEEPTHTWICQRTYGEQ